MYKSLEEIIIAEKEQNLPFWKCVMKDDCVELDITEEESFQRMKQMYQVMKEADEAYEDNLMSRRRESGREACLWRFYRTSYRKSD